MDIQINAGNIITFTKSRLPYGWLGNMSPYPVRLAPHGLEYPTAEHLFQALRFSPEDATRDEIRQQRSPMAAKFLAHGRAGRMVLLRGGTQDLANMRLVLRLKVEQHPDLREALLATGSKVIIEDVTKRAGRGSALFWGMTQHEPGHWEGENTLGVFWMELRASLRSC